jgi:hypothetical protein
MWYNYFNIKKKGMRDLFNRPWWPDKINRLPLALLKEATARNQ